jgi:hypothetical protein
MIAQLCEELAHAAKAGHHCRLVSRNGQVTCANAQKPVVLHLEHPLSVVEGLGNPNQRHGAERLGIHGSSLLDGLRCNRYTGC